MLVKDWSGMNFLDLRVIKHVADSQRVYDLVSVVLLVICHCFCFSFTSLKAFGTSNSC